MDIQNGADPDQLVTGEKNNGPKKNWPAWWEEKTDQFGDIVGRDQTPPPVQKFSLNIPAARNITILFEAER